MKKELNHVSLAKYGQETVHEITDKAQQLFHSIHSSQKLTVIQARQREIKTLFERLRRIYKRLSKFLQENRMEYIEVESLVPYNDGNPRQDHWKYNSEIYKVATKEREELQKQVSLKNQEIKESVDLMRKTIFEINNMLAMVKDDNQMDGKQ